MWVASLSRRLAALPPSPSRRGRGGGHRHHPGLDASGRRPGHLRPAALPLPAGARPAHLCAPGACGSGRAHLLQKGGAPLQRGAADDGLLCSEQGAGAAAALPAPPLYLGEGLLACPASGGPGLLPGTQAAGAPLGQLHGRRLHPGIRHPPQKQAQVVRFLAGQHVTLAQLVD